MFPLPQVAGSKLLREGIDSSTSMHSIMVSGKDKNTFWQNKRRIHKNIENKKRAVIVKCYVKDTVLSLKRIFILICSIIQKETSTKMYTPFLIGLN